jgi:predicted O-methyltransferase YrrM
MKMNDIPGWFHGPHQTETIKLLWKYNQPDCVGVEVGCLHGRSSYAISLAIHKGTLYCIDLWDGRDSYDQRWNDELIAKYNLPPKGSFNIKETFLKNTEGRKNIVAIQGSSPEVVKDWTKPIDFIFLDSSHLNPNDRDNIDFWLPKIKPGGTFLGHDWYEDHRIPDVNVNVEYMEDLLKQKVTIIPRTSIWYFTLPKI